MAYKDNFTECNNQNKEKSDDNIMTEEEIIKSLATRELEFLMFFDEE